MVIGFAAAPGQPALDGAPGEPNSPYAAALLKHFAAGGYAFGDLMTLVTEEVYLKTGARQIPWMNSSLRRVLSFGAPIESSGDDELLIRDGRRKLLLSIAALPSEVRAQVQTAAADAAVPMDTLYGLLDALGTEAPENPEALDQLLRSQTDALRQIMDERRALTSTDPEITRLASLAQQALDEGAMQVSVGFWEQAKARYQQISATLDATEAELEQRRREGGALLASVADTYVLSGDYAAAAENFGLAFAEIERWDDALALTYKGKQADALFRQGDEKGDNSAIERAIALYHEMANDMGSTDARWGELQSGLGSAYAQLGERTGNTGLIRDGVAAFRAAIASYDRDTQPSRWATAQAGLATALSIAANTNTDPAELQESIDAYRAALEVLTPDGAPRDWARAQGNLGAALTLQARRDSKIETFDAAAAAVEAAMSVDTLDRAPLSWANLKDRIGTILMMKAQADDNPATLRDAIAAYREALTVATQDKAPLVWAGTQGNLATALWQLGEATNDVPLVEEAIATYKASLAELTPERALNDWALALSNMAAAQMAVGRALNNADHVRASADTYREALSRYDREQGELLWALLQGNRSATLNVLGQIENTAAPFVESEAAARASLTVRTRDTGALEWAASQNNLGDALAGQARFTDGTDLLIEAIAAYHAAIEVRSGDGPPGDRAHTQMLLGDALFELGLREDVGVERYSDALDVYGAAADYYTAANQPLDYATIADKAGWVLANVGFRLQSRDAFSKARDAIQSAWDKVKASGQSQHDAYFAERIGMIDDALKALPPAP